MIRAAALIAAVAFALVTALAPLQPRTAQAGEVWCWDDPVFEVGGRTVAVNIGIREADLAAVTGATIVLTVPDGVSARVVSVESTTYTPNVQIVSGGPWNRRGIVVSVDVLVSAGRTFDYQFTVTAAGGRGDLAATTRALSNRRQRLQFALR